MSDTLLPADRTPDGIAATYTATHITIEAINAETGDSCGTFTIARRLKPSVWRAQNELQAQANDAGLKARQLSEQLETERARVEGNLDDMDTTIVEGILAEVSRLAIEANRQTELFAKSTWADQWPALVEALDDAVDGENWISVCAWLGRIRAEVTAHESEEASVPLD